VLGLEHRHVTGPGKQCFSVGGSSDVLCSPFRPFSDAAFKEHHKQEDSLLLLQSFFFFHSSVKNLAFGFHIFLVDRDEPPVSCLLCTRLPLLRVFILFERIGILSQLFFPSVAV